MKSVLWLQCLPNSVMSTTGSIQSFTKASILVINNFTLEENVPTFTTPPIIISNAVCAGEFMKANLINNKILYLKIQPNLLNDTKSHT